MGGMGFRPRIERHAVSERLRFRASVLKEDCVSPRPWRRMRTLIGLEPEGGGIMSRVRLGEKSDLVGRREGIFGVVF